MERIMKHYKWSVRLATLSLQREGKHLLASGTGGSRDPRFRSNPANTTRAHCGTCSKSANKIRGLRQPADLKVKLLVEGGSVGTSVSFIGRNSVIHGYRNSDKPVCLTGFTTNLCVVYGQNPSKQFHSRTER